MLGVIQRGEQFCFTLESRQSIGIARERVGQYFDRDLALQPRIFRVIHLAHAARAQERDDLISAESSAGGERLIPVEGSAVDYMLVASAGCCFCDAAGSASPTFHAA